MASQLRLIEATPVIIKNRFVLLLGAVAAFLVCACHSAKGILLTEREEFGLAQEYMKDKKWDKARDHFQKLADRYPGSALASEAVLNKAETYFMAKDYSEAKTEYQMFLEVYPAHEKADFAEYRVALCQIEGMRSIDRDQVATVDSVKTLERLIASYPNSPHLPEAKERLAAAKERLKRHDLYVARFYR